MVTGMTDELEETISVALDDDRERIAELIEVAADLCLTSPYPTESALAVNAGMAQAASMVRRGGAA